MKIDNSQNYTIISNHINENLLNELRDYTIIDDNISFDSLVEKIYNFPVKTICFNDSLRNFTRAEKQHIMELLNKRQVNFINITSDMDEVLFGDYLYVFYYDKIAMEGKTIEVLKEEKILKRLGFNLPFVFNLSLQLKLYGILTDVETDLGKLVSTLWN